MPLSPRRKDCTTSVFGRHGKRMSASTSSAVLIVALAPLARNSAKQRSLALLTIRSALEKIVSDRPAHLTKANETEFHVCSPALAF
jgi:hypothetical protein